MLKSLTFLTNCSAAARISSSVTGALLYGMLLAFELFPYLSIIQLMADPNDNL